jgi:sulfide:quinone oxidoreductase
MAHGANSHRTDTHVLIAGGGVAGLEAMLALRALAEDRVTIDLLTPETEFVYGPLAVAEPFGLDRRAHFDLGDLLREAGARHHPDALASVDAERRRARTRVGIEFPYDALLVATGAQYRDPLPGAVTFPGQSGVTGMARVLRELDTGKASTVAFALASRHCWSLPLYELALMTSNRLSPQAREEVRLTFVTPEHQPLELFGSRAGAVIGNRLLQGGLQLLTDRFPDEYSHGTLRLAPDGTVRADHVVTTGLPVGPATPGLPADEDGFLPVDVYGRVEGVEGVYAAGDAASFPIKQGGLAAQQADVAALSIAAAAGALVTPAPFRPVLRGLLMTGAVPAYVRAPSMAAGGVGGDVSVEPLWWPPAKIAARYLGPFLAARSGRTASPDVSKHGVVVAREFDRDAGEWRELEGTPAPDPLTGEAVHA